MPVVRRSGFLHHAEIGEPLLKSDVPGPERDPVATFDAAAMSAVRVDMQVGGNYRP